MPTGVAQLNDMSTYYVANGLTSFQGNLGAVPGSSESEAPLANNPAWLQPDFINW
jgi:hypothetical protein